MCGRSATHSVIQTGNRRRHHPYLNGRNGRSRLSRQDERVAPADGLLSARDVRRLAATAGLRPRKARGQNFVVDPNTVRRIVRLAGVGPTDTVLEVGPGLGSLTLGLLGAGAQVVAVEIEPVLARLLPSTVRDVAGAEAAARLAVLAADASTVAAGDLPRAPDALVSNLPYNVAVPVLLGLLERVPSLAEGTGHDAAGGRRAADRFPGRAGVRGADREAGAGGRPRNSPGESAGTPSGRCPTSTRRWSRSAGSPRRDPTWPTGPSPRSSTPPSGSGERRCARRWPPGRGRRAGPSGCWSRPASTRAGAGRRCCRRLRGVAEVARDRCDQPVITHSK